jgi:hypothetical protein
MRTGEVSIVYIPTHHKGGRTRKRNRHADARAITAYPHRRHIHNTRAAQFTAAQALATDPNRAYDFAVYFIL